MRKRFEEDQDDNQDRWLVSYADLITLMFAFFVVMYAISSVNESKHRALTESLVSAFAAMPVAPVAPVIQPALPVKPTLPPKRSSDTLRREKERMTRIGRDIQHVLAPLVNEGKVRVTHTERGVRVEINASVLFAPGDATLANGTSEALKVVASVLKDHSDAIQVEGHTDSVPIRNASFPSNWELSAVRASSVVRLFVESGVTESRLSAVGRGPTQPVASNDTPEGRLRNRRVAVMILSPLPETVTEVPVEAGSKKKL
jgi:chemotaxis protein MotB